jgi:hypothetical protein
MNTKELQTALWEGFERLSKEPTHKYTRGDIIRAFDEKYRDFVRYRLLPPPETRPYYNEETYSYDELIDRLPELECLDGRFILKCRYLKRLYFQLGTVNNERIRMAQPRRSRWYAFIRFLFYRPATVLWFLAYVGVSIFLVLNEMFAQLRNEKNLEIFGYGALIAKCFGELLEFNSALTLLLTLKSLTTRIRQIPILNKIIPVDDFIRFHQVIGVVIAVSGTVHTIAHYSNFYRISRITDLDFLRETFSLNNHYGYAELLFSTIPGVTGHLMILYMMVTYPFAIWRHRSGCFSRSLFQAFFLSHQLYVVYYICLILHGLHGLLGSSPSFVYWIFVPALLWMVDTILRCLTKYHTVKVLNTSFWNTDTTDPNALSETQVISIRVEKPNGFVYLPGQYSYLRYLPVSLFEKHPFSFTSAPRDDFLEFHIRIKGLWTKSLYALLLTNPYNQEVVIEGVRKPMFIF